MRWIAGLITAAMFVWTAVPAGSDIFSSAYRPAQSITVVSTSLLPDVVSAKSEETAWRIVPETIEDSSFALGFYRRQNPDQPVCRLVPSGPHPGLYLGDGRTYPHVSAGGELMVFPGFSIPCDILPVHTICSTDEPGIYDIRRQVGERGFTDQWQAECLTITRSEALSAGWIRDDSDVAEPLFWIQVTRLRDKELLVRQLWQPGDSWWLYEETPYRRSWRTK